MSRNISMINQQVFVSRCVVCGESFYEFEEDYLVECPHCHANLEDNVPDMENGKYITLQVDPFTGEISTHKPEGNPEENKE